MLHVDGVPLGRTSRALAEPSPSGASEPTLAEKKLDDLEAVFSALAHEQRRHILLTIHFRGGELSAGAIADRFSCSWPTTSRHLRVLQKSGLVRVEKRGRERYYQVDKKRLEDVAGGWLAWFDK